jgi:hypothetical protein
VRWPVNRCLLTVVYLLLPFSAAYGQPFTITIGPPGAQTSSVASNGVVETFDELTPGAPTNFAFDSVGIYNQGNINRANVFGGAGGTGNFLTANNTTLMLDAPQRYFGMWWSAGDPRNVLQFYSGNALLQTFTTKDVINYINNLPAAERAMYYGNPNANFKGGDGGEPFAFINFFADPDNESVTFNKIVFSGSGFESDNHTINGSYTVVVGDEVDPEPIDPGPGDVIQVGGGGVVTDTTPAMIAGGSEVMVDPGGVVNDTAPVMIGPGGDVAGGGTVAAPMVMNDGMLVSDGMTIDGNYQQMAGGMLAIPAPGDALTVNGKAMLGGELIVDVPPRTGEVVEVLSATNGISGQFAAVADPLDTKGLGIAVVDARNGVDVA